jgi:hypothetical protein
MTGEKSHYEVFSSVKKGERRGFNKTRNSLNYKRGKSPFDQS